MTIPLGEERTARYARDGIATYWVTPVNAWWLWKIPGFRLDLESYGAHRVNRGVAQFGPHDSEVASNQFHDIMFWQTPEDSSLETLLRGIAEERIVVREIDPSDAKNLEGCYSSSVSTRLAWTF